MRLAGLLMLVALPCLAQEDGHGPEVDLEDADQLTVTTAPVQSDLFFQCRFERECIEAEPCAESGFDPVIDAHAGGLDPEVLMVEAQMIGDGGNTFMMGAQDHGRVSLMGGDFDARHLLTIAPDGAARYTVHLAEGPRVVSYLGTCVAQE